MTHFICVACGTQLAARESTPEACPVCSDERQFVPAAGQRWTTLEALRAAHRNTTAELEPGVTAIWTTPSFAIGQRAILIETSAGNFLWDCIALLDDATIELIRSRGGIRGIAISHPHYYTTVVDWSRALGNVPIHLHEADRSWVLRPDPAIRFWRGSREVLLPGLTLIHCGGHFEGAAALHWREGAGGKGVLFSGDTVQVVSDPRHVSFMRSYPNLIPLPAETVERIGRILEPVPFERIYGAWWDRETVGDAKEAVRRSVSRYVAALGSSRDA